MRCGAVTCAAAAATSPKRSRRPLGVCVMTLFSARHSAAGTPHCAAAADISISRAVAPAVRSACCEPRTERLAPVDMSPHARWRLRFSSGATYSGVTRLQSQASSSATSIGNAVDMPCPISDLATRMTTESSGAMMIQAVISALPSDPCVGMLSNGIAKPSVSEPPNAAALARSERRSSGAMVVTANVASK